MLFVMLRLNDEKIISDNEIDVEDAYKVITDAYKSKGAYLFTEKDGIKYYTIEKSEDDFQYLWMVNLALDKVDWFKKYIAYWRYVETDDDGEIEYEEDLIDNQTI